MDQGPLVIEEIDVGAELVRQFDSYLPVKAAFWLKVSDDPYRYLYIASDQINEANFDLAYREVARLAGQIRSPYLNLFRVKVVGMKSPFAQEAVATHEWFPGPMAIRFGEKTFGGVSIDDAYLYPRPLQVAGGV